MTTIKEVSDNLHEYIDMLNITENTEYIIVKTRKFLGSEIFAKISAIIRGGGGEYISMGKESHWRILKTQANSKLQNEGNHIQHAMDYLAMALDELKQAGYTKPSA